MDEFQAYFPFHEGPSGSQHAHFGRHVGGQIGGQKGSSRGPSSGLFDSITKTRDLFLWTAGYVRCAWSNYQKLFRFDEFLTDMLSSKLILA